MKKTIFLLLALATLGMSGCATNWQHTSITDPEIAAKQLSADERYCYLVASGAAPVPQISTPVVPTVTNVSGQIRTHNTATGQTTYSTYKGQATNMPSGGFAGGLASGMANGAALGAALEAAQRQRLIREECMSAKGWTKVPSGASPALPMSMMSKNTLLSTQNPTRISMDSADPTGVLTCRVGSASGTHENPGEQFDFQVKISDAKIWHGVFKREIPLTTAEEEYRWKVNLRDISPTAENITVIGAINRYSGEYREVLAGDKGVVPWSKGACKKLDRAF